MFFDSDIIIKPTTLSEFISSIKKNKVVLVQSNVTTTSAHKGFAPDLLAVTWNYLTEKMAPHATYVSTMSFCIKRDVFFEIGKFKKAKESYWKAVDLDPKNLIAQKHLALLMAERGDTDQAIESYKKALKLEPDDYSLHLLLGKMYAKKGCSIL